LATDTQHGGEGNSHLSGTAAGDPHSIDGYQIDINGNKMPVLPHLRPHR